MNNDVLTIAPRDTIYVSYEVSGFNSETNKNESNSNKFFTERTTDPFDADTILNINDETKFFSLSEVVARILTYFVDSPEYSGCSICIFNWWVQKSF